MKWLSVILTSILLLLAIPSIPASAAGDTSIEEAVKLAESGNMEKAISDLETIVAAEPGNYDALAWLGFYTGMSAGQAKDYMEAGRLTMRSFELMDKAVAADENNPRAYLFRGIMGVKVPDFLGKLDGGLKDLEKAVGFFSAGSSEESRKGLITALTTLDEGYAKKGDLAGRHKALEMIVKMAPGSEAATKAKVTLSALPESIERPATPPPVLSPSEKDDPDTSVLRKKAAEDPENTAALLELGKALFAKERFGEATEVLRHFVGIDDSNPEAYRLLSLSVGMEASPGYDENIYEDTDHRSKLAFESITFMDRAVALSPGDMELRLRRGTYGIMFPFFLGKFEQGIEDLKMIEASDAPEAIKAEALYYLGVAKQREALRYWIKVAKEFQGTDAEKMVYETLRPTITRLDSDKLEGPFVKIDFVLGFQDELPPQTAIWIENKNGDYVSTVYVSGFAGYVMEKQVTLPAWARGSGFEGLDGVTGASIDVGHHIYAWDLRDYNGKKVEKGDYTVKVETCYWPSMKYQVVESTVSTGKKDYRKSVQEGDFIPWLEVSYIDR